MKLERVKRELGLDEQELSFLVGSEGRLKERMAQLGMRVVRETLIRHRWNKSRAAVELATTALVAGVLGAWLLIRLARVNAAIAFVATLPGGGLLLALRQPNAWVLGPLFGVGVFAAAGVDLSALPTWVVNGGQRLIGASLGALSGSPATTLLLAAAPGGVAEMSITAQVLHLDVPLVTACHVLRVIVLTVGAVPVYRWYARRVGGVG